MTIARCPSCGDQVRVPATISDQATLRCPLCQETFDCEAVTASLPPVLEVVHDPQAQEVPVLAAAATGFQGISIHGDGGGMVDGGLATEGRDNGNDASPDLPAFEFEEASAPQREAPSFSESVTGSNGETTRRRPSKPANPLPQMIGVILGGLASIPLAQLCLWWIFSTDPVDAGPFVAQYVPFIVPADFRGVTGEEEDELDDPLEDGFLGGDERPGRTLLGSNDPTPFLNNENDSDAGGSNDANATTDDEQANGGLGSNSSIPDVLNKSPEELRNPSVPIDPMYVGLADPHETLRKRRKTTADQIYEDFQGVLDGFEVWSTPAEAESETRSESIDQYYHSMCELGSSLLYVDPDDQRSVQAALSIQETLSSHFRDDSDKLQRFIGNRAARLLQQPTDLVGNGVALAGSLISVEREGDYLASRIRLDDVGRTEVTVYGWLKPPRHFERGCKVLVLGERLSDPAGALDLSVNETEVIAGSFLFILETGGDDDDRQTVSDDSEDRSNVPTNGRNAIIE